MYLPAKKWDCALKSSALIARSFCNARQLLACLGKSNNKDAVRIAA
jgi:hypothetical protein